MEAALQVAHHLNGSNLRDTGHSSERSRMAVLADQQSVSKGFRDADCKSVAPRNLSSVHIPSLRYNTLSLLSLNRAS